MIIKNKIFIVFVFSLLLIFSCKTLEYKHYLTVRLNILPGSFELDETEMKNGIYNYLVEYGFRPITGSQSSIIETEWQNISAIADDLMQILGQINTLTTSTLNHNHYSTQIKYFFHISEKKYSIRAKKRIIETTPAYYNARTNNASEILPNSELWKNMELMAQEINKYLGFTRYNLTAERISKK